MKYLWIIILLVALIGGSAYLSRNKDQNTQSNNSTGGQAELTETKEEVASDSTNNTTENNFSPTGTKIAANYYAYTKTDYDAALAAKKPVFLYFYANWCPTCAEQEPIVRSLMNDIADQSKLDDFVAFRINFNDSDTDKDEEALAKQFGVTYQHTMFVLNEDGQQVKKLLGQTSQEALKSALLEAV